MSVSVDGFVSDRAGRLSWGTPSDEQFAFTLAQVGELGAYVCGRRLYEAMVVWETDPDLRRAEASAAFADVWSALPKIVLSRTLDRVEGNARLASGPLEQVVAEVQAGTDRDVSIGGADLVHQAIGLGLLDEIRMFRNPVVLGGGTPLLPPVPEPVLLDLVETRTFAERVVYERYRVVRTATAPA